MKHSYATTLKIAHHFGLLSKYQTLNIPKSTLHEWKKIDPNKFIGSDIFSNEDFLSIKKFYASKNRYAFHKAIDKIYVLFSVIFSVHEIRTLVENKFKTDVVNLITNCRVILGFNNLTLLFGISNQKFYSWKKNICNKSALKKCYKIYYNQLTFNEVSIISKHLSVPDFFHWPLVAIYYKLLRNNIINISLSTFYKYAKFLNLTNLHKPFRKAKQLIGIRASKPFEIIHMDITELRCLDGTKAFISLIVDNFSRTILAAKVSLTKTSEMVLENLTSAIDVHHLKNLDFDVSLMVDDGSENKGAVENFISNGSINMKKVIAFIDVMFSNSMIEAVNKRIKYDYLFRLKPKNFKELELLLPDIVINYNNRPHSKLYGLHPLEALSGQIPDTHKFTQNIKSAVSARRAENPKLICADCPV